MGKNNETPGQDDSRYAAKMLWITATLNDNYNFDGSTATVDAAEHLAISLEALRDNRTARTIAQQLASSRPEGSAARADLTNWWITNLFHDEGLHPLGRLSELARAVKTGNTNVSAYFQAELGSRLIDRETSSSTINFALLQMKLTPALEPLCQTTLETHAPRLAAICLAADIYALLEHAEEYGLDKLYDTAKAGLARVDALLLRRWHGKLRQSMTAPKLQSDIASAYGQSLRQIAQTDPSAAWLEIQNLQGLWNEGHPAILLPEQAPLAEIFTHIACHNPHEASSIEARRIQAEIGIPARRQALAEAQERVIALPAAQQLEYLGQLHARVLFQPELVGPSREQLLKVYQAHPEAGMTERLYELAAGDDVLRNTLSPPVPLPLPARKPGLIARTVSALRRNLGKPGL